jgi:AcrR family transcriptional regulator
MLYNMSRDAKSTREQILAAARELLETRGYFGVGLEDIGKAAGVSRQAVYLHFRSKAGLLLALVDWVDRHEDLGRRIEWIRAAGDPVQSLERWVEVAIGYEPRIHRLALVLDAARSTDEAAAAAWDDRMAHRRRGCGHVISALSKAGRLADEWTVETATDWLWTLGSVKTYEDLTVACGWSTAAAVRHLSRVAMQTLVRPSRRAPRPARH